MLRVFDPIRCLELSVRGDHVLFQQLLKYPNRKKGDEVKANGVFVCIKQGDALQHNVV